MNYGNFINQLNVVHEPAETALLGFIVSFLILENAICWLSFFYFEHKLLISIVEKLENQIILVISINKEYIPTKKIFSFLILKNYI